MKTTTFRHENVLSDGTFSNKSGAVVTTASVTMSYNNESGGCGLSGCNCSPGHWLSIVKARTDDGIVEGFTIHFDNKNEMDEHIALIQMERQ
jgi:hypothetical protein